MFGHDPLSAESQEDFASGADSERPGGYSAVQGAARSGEADIEGIEDIWKQTDPEKSYLLNKHYWHLDADGIDHLGMTLEDYWLIGLYFELSGERDQRKGEYIPFLERGEYDKVRDDVKSQEQLKDVHADAVSWVIHGRIGDDYDKHFPGRFVREDFDLMIEYLVNKLKQDPEYSSKGEHRKSAIDDLQLLREDRVLNRQPHGQRHTDLLGFLGDAHMWKHGTHLSTADKKTLSAATLNKVWRQPKDKPFDKPGQKEVDALLKHATVAQVKNELDSIYSSAVGLMRMGRAMDEVIRLQPHHPVVYKGYIKEASVYFSHTYTDLERGLSIAATAVSAGLMIVWAIMVDPMWATIVLSALIPVVSGAVFVSGRIMSDKALMRSYSEAWRRFGAIPYVDALDHVSADTHKTGTTKPIPRRNVDYLQRASSPPALLSETGGTPSAPAAPSVSTPATAARLSAAEEEFTAVVNEIASYETDISKAITYPAFNDVSTPEVSVMSKQLRRCHRVLSDINAITDRKGRLPEDSAEAHSLVADFVRQVDDLVIDTEAAKSAAERIAWSGVSEVEQSDLKQAQGLMAHASDPANTDDMRANYYRQLKRVVDRLNRSRTVVPAKIVGEIEQASMLLIESSAHTGYSVSDVLGDGSISELALEKD